MKIDDKSFERVEIFGNNPNESNFQEEIKSRLKSGNARSHLVQYLLSSSFPSKNIKIRDTEI
jgi:hypothetical protein